MTNLFYAEFEEIYCPKIGEELNFLQNQNMRGLFY